MRRTIGKRLLESTQQLPHFYATAEINMGELYEISEGSEFSFSPNHLSDAREEEEREKDKADV